MDEVDSVTFDIQVQSRQEQSFWDLVKQRIQEGYNITVSFKKRSTNNTLTPSGGQILQHTPLSTPNTCDRVSKQQQTDTKKGTAVPSQCCSQISETSQKRQLKIDEMPYEADLYHQPIMGPYIHFGQITPSMYQSQGSFEDFAPSTPLEAISPNNSFQELKPPKTFEDHLNRDPLYQRLQGIKGELSHHKWKSSLKHLLELHTSAHKAAHENLHIKQKVMIVICIQCLVYMAECQKYLGLTSNALETLESCLKTYQVNDPDLLCTIHEEIAYLRLLSMQFNRALDAYRALLVIYEKLNWKVQLTFVLCKIGYIYALFDYPQESKRISYAAYDDLRELVGLGDLRIAYMLDLLGMICLLHKEWEFAQTHLQQALAIKHEDPEHPIESTIHTMQLLGIAYQHSGEFSLSFKMYSKALEMMGHHPSIQQAQIYNNLGLLSLQDGELIDAEVAFQYAKHTYLEFFDEDSVHLKRLERNIMLLSIAKHHSHKHH